MTFRILSPDVIAQLCGDDLVALDLARLPGFRIRAPKAARVVIGEHSLTFDEFMGKAASAPKGKAVAIIPLQGVLMPKGGEDWFGAWQGMDRTRAQLAAAAASPDIAAIVLDVDSPGGSVAGTPETGAAVAAATQAKKVVAMVDGLCCSAAYWIASQANEVVATPSSDIGSIGVYSIHAEYSQALRNSGIALTITKSSDSPFKAEGNPYEPDTDTARAFRQQRVDSMCADFIRAVATGRGATQTNVRETYGRGRALDAKTALSFGMIDSIGDMGGALSRLAPASAPAKSRALRARARAF